MSVVYSRDWGTIDFGNQYVRPDWSEARIGYVRSSVQVDRFGDVPCRILPETAATKHDHRALTYWTGQAAIWWVAKNDHILREWESRIGPGGEQHADAIYRKDSIDLTVDKGASEKRTTVFPANGMKPIDDQFQPMFLDGKVLQPKRSMDVLDPFTGGFEHWSVSSVGPFKGATMNISFEGQTFEMQRGKESQVV